MKWVEVVLVFILFFASFGVNKGTSYGHEEPKDIILLAGPGNTTHFFYQQVFWSLDSGYTDWVSLSSVNFQFEKPRRVGGEFHFARQDEAELLNAKSFEDEGIVTFYTQPGSIEEWGIYSREWDSSNKMWGPSRSLMVGEPSSNEFLSAQIDKERILHGIYKEGSAALYFQRNTSSEETLMSIPVSPGTGLVVGNSTNIILAHSLSFRYFNGTSLGSVRYYPFTPATWKTSRSGEIVLGGLDPANHTFSAFTVVADGWIRNEFDVPTNWTQIWDWEIGTKGEFHLIANTSSAYPEYSVLSSQGVQQRDIRDLGLKNIVDLAIHPNGSAYLGGFNIMGDLGVVRLSLDSPLNWVSAVGWDSLSGCGYSDCGGSIPAFSFWEVLGILLVLGAVVRTQRLWNSRR